MLVTAVDIFQNGGLERLCAAVHATAQLLLREQREPALYQVHPGGADRGEVQVNARALGQPAPNPGRLVGGVVVQDQMDVQVRRNGRLDGVEEFAELDGPMPPVTLPDDLA